MRSLVIIPTYNEKENISRLVPEILGRGYGCEILVVDDNSPDGTAEIVRNLQREHGSHLHLLLRAGKEGLGKAYLAGFHWALDRGYEGVIEMDADFSHRPVDLGKILKTLESEDFVIGSRYILGGATVNWGILRKIISQGGSLYSRLILGYPIRDWTGGFNGWSRKVLEAIGLSGVKSEGYSFQIELKYKALKKGFSYKEVPIVFEDRRVGQSKMSFRIVLEAFVRVWGIRASE